MEKILQGVSFKYAMDLYLWYDFENMWEDRLDLYQNPEILSYIDILSYILDLNNALKTWNMPLRT